MEYRKTATLNIDSSKEIQIGYDVKTEAAIKERIDKDVRMMKARMAEWILFLTDKSVGKPLTINSAPVLCTIQKRQPDKKNEGTDTQHAIGSKDNTASPMLQLSRKLSFFFK